MRPQSIGHHHAGTARRVDRSRRVRRLGARGEQRYDRVIGLDLSDVSLDGSLHKSPCGGEGTGKNPTDRGKLGWKWSILTDRNGIPFGVAIDGANRNDSVMLAPTLDERKSEGLLNDVETFWLDRGYDSTSHGNGSPSTTSTMPSSPKGERGVHQRRRKTSRWDCDGRWSGPTRGSRTTGRSAETRTARAVHRLAQLSLAIVFLLTAKLIDWRNRWSPAPVTYPLRLLPAWERRRPRTITGDGQLLNVDG